MKSTGIVSEFNPFHNGHKYLIDSVREKLSPDAVVCIMSGNFVQRGGPAAADKWSRARMAVAGGADLVVELPAVYACGGASQFAAGAVAVMKGLGIDSIAFGSESGGMIELEGKLHDGAVTPIDMKNRPNDILALEYMKQNRLQGAGLEEFTVPRKGAGHDSGKTADSTASASYIRNLLNEGASLAEIADFVPSEALEILGQTRLLGAEGQKRWFDLVRYVLLTKTPEEIASVPGAYGGIEYRLIDAAKTAGSLDELILGAKAKRYAYAGLSRLVTRLVLGITAEDMAAEGSSMLAYARVLAFNDAGAAFLKEARKNASIPVLSNIGKNLADDAPQQRLLSVDTRASDIYSILLDRSIYDSSDHVMHPGKI